MTEKDIEEIKRQDELEEIRKSAALAVLAAFLAVMAGTFLIFMILSGIKEAVCQM